MKKRTKKPEKQDKLESLGAPRKGAGVSGFTVLPTTRGTAMVREFNSFADDLDDFIEQILKS